MKYVVYGAGAVGGVIGGHLHLAGLPVTLVARGAHLAAIRSDGLVLDAGDGRHRIDAPATDTAAEVAWTDDTVVVLAVKSHQAAVALADLREHAPAGTAIVCATNGIATETAALRLFARTYAVCVMLPSSHLEPGVVVAACHPTPAILDIGRYPSGVDVTAEQVAGAFEKSGIVSVPRHDIMRWKYRKLLMNLGNAVQAVCRPDDDRLVLLDLLRAEGEAVLMAADIDPVSEEEDRERRGDILQIAQVPGRPRSGGSTWQSLERRTGAIESDFLNGEIVWLGRLHGVDTPANELMRREAVRLAREGLPPNSIPARALLDVLNPDG